MLLTTEPSLQSHTCQSSIHRVTEKEATKARDTGKAFTCEKPYRKCEISPEKEEGGGSEGGVITRKDIKKITRKDTKVQAARRSLKNTMKSRPSKVINC
jgi:hypothetical protein